MINDYATLKASLATWLARADLAASIPDFIQLAETRINRELRVRQMQVTTTGTIATGTLTLPVDLREIQSFRVSIGGRYVELNPLPPDALQVATVVGYPIGYVVVNGVLNLIGTNGSIDYALTYWQTIPSLSDSTTQNWLILREPGLYLYGALCETAPFLKEDQRLVTWGTLYTSIRDGMKAEDDRARYGNAPSIQTGIACAP